MNAALARQVDVIVYLVFFVILPRTDFLLEQSGKFLQIVITQAGFFCNRLHRIHRIH